MSPNTPQNDPLLNVTRILLIVIKETFEFLHILLNVTKVLLNVTKILLNVTKPPVAAHLYRIDGRSTCLCWILCLGRVNLVFRVLFQRFPPSCECNLRFCAIVQSLKHNCGGVHHFD